MNRHAEHRPLEVSAAVRSHAAQSDEAPDPGAEVLDRIKAIDAERCRLEAEQIQLMDRFVALARADGINAPAGGRRAGEPCASFAKDEISAELSWSRHTGCRSRCGSHAAAAPSCPRCGRCGAHM